MIIYSVTVKIDHDIQEDWLKWMKEKHIPDVMNTSMFKSSKLCRIIGQEDDDGIAYNIQYECENMKTLHQYQVQFAQALQKEHTERYEGKFAAFRTLLEVL